MGTFDESPEPTEPHLINYMSMLGGILLSHRKNHPVKRFRSSESFADDKISPYFGKKVGRRTINKAEQGDHKVSFGVYAAILQEMNVWPEIIDSIASNKNEDYRHVAIITKELQKKKELENKERLAKLQQKFLVRE